MGRRFFSNFHRTSAEIQILALVFNRSRNGGDGYAMFKGASNAYDFGPDLADVTAEYLAANAPYTPYTDGRITKK
ncbi:hypothetical protein SAMN05421762_1446 [Pseudooceanicola nitratireducens]|jgi:5'-nucleotidase|uniref:5'-nucleotidase, C-terminal domain n=1 Tax=Pseudooceanicola nitratireducens TaxID=517719 RepID=A0A1I1KDT6_9RHOB|nr:hypothetical protein SAMN05216183_103349 [Pseudooceanicola nitratireducens]SFC59019.1 hypothetical protein SAMN05421762_1446 [Pseudooceanicola nitratireducens]